MGHAENKARIRELIMDLLKDRFRWGESDGVGEGESRVCVYNGVRIRVSVWRGLNGSARACWGAGMHDKSVVGEFSEADARKVLDTFDQWDKDAITSQSDHVIAALFGEKS